MNKARLSAEFKSRKTRWTKSVNTGPTMGGEAPSVQMSETLPLADVSPFPNAEPMEGTLHHANGRDRFVLNSLRLHAAPS
eukprot:3935142-Amphidinium_carterae.1